MTPEQLSTATGATAQRATQWLPYIEAAMAEFGIDTPARQAAFLAQIGHESGGLHWVTELWGPTLAQIGYEGRADLGNIEDNDGLLFRGRGLIQTTGRTNYKATGDALGVDLVGNPALLSGYELAARSAGWFWQSHGLNELADAGEFVRITRRINGGTNGLADRTALYKTAQEVLA
jgi:putative chitinase